MVCALLPPHGQMSNYCSQTREPSKFIISFSCHHQYMQSDKTNVLSRYTSNKIKLQHTTPDPQLVHLPERCVFPLFKGAKISTVLRKPEWFRTRARTHTRLSEHTHTHTLELMLSGVLLSKMFFLLIFMAQTHKRNFFKPGQGAQKSKDQTHIQFYLWPHSSF